MKTYILVFTENPGHRPLFVEWTVMWLNFYPRVDLDTREDQYRLIITSARYKYHHLPGGETEAQILGNSAKVTGKLGTQPSAGSSCPWASPSFRMRGGDGYDEVIYLHDSGFSLLSKHGASFPKGSGVAICQLCSNL